MSNNKTVIALDDRRTKWYDCETWNTILRETWRRVKARNWVKVIQMGSENEIELKSVDVKVSETFKNCCCQQTLQTNSKWVDPWEASLFEPKAKSSEILNKKLKILKINRKNGWSSFINESKTLWLLCMANSTVVLVFPVPCSTMSV